MRNYRSGLSFVKIDQQMMYVENDFKMACFSKFFRCDTFFLITNVNLIEIIPIIQFNRTIIIARDSDSIKCKHFFFRIK